MSDEERLQSAKMCEQLHAIRSAYSELYREHEALKNTKYLPDKEWIQWICHQALFDTRCGGISQNGYNIIVKTFKEVGDKLGFSIDPNWVPKIVEPN